MIQTYDSPRQSKFNDWQEIDIIVSRDCTLRCKYCYLKKYPDEHYDVDAIVAQLDRYLGNIENERIGTTVPEGIVLSFYPEPWVNPERTNELVLRCLDVLLKHPPYDQKFMIMAGTNGVNLHKKIPAFEHVRERLSLSVTLDGVKEQHDMYRVFSDGSPSWKIVKNNILKFQDEYGIFNTKITLGPDTLKFIDESTKFCFEEMNFTEVNMNVVFENLWGDRGKFLLCLAIFEDRISKLFDYVLKHDRWKTHYISLLGTRNIPSDQIDNLRKRPAEGFLNRVYCGAAQMRSIDSDGSLYPCFRLSPYSLDGDVRFKLNSDNIRALRGLSLFDSADEECRACPILTACPMCVGGAVEESSSIFYRTKHHCEFQKIQYRWSVKLFNHLNPENQLECLL